MCLIGESNKAKGVDGLFIVGERRAKEKKTKSQFIFKKEGFSKCQTM